MFQVVGTPFSSVKYKRFVDYESIKRSKAVKSWVFSSFMMHMFDAEEFVGLA
jgi:hypothetical protein